MLNEADLPDDLEALKRLVLDARGQLDRLNSAHEQAQSKLLALHETYEKTRAELIAEQLEVERLRFQIACFKRRQYGRSSEQLDAQIAQLSLTLEDLEASQAALPPRPASQATPTPTRPARRPLPAHLPREVLTHAPACSCPDCGAQMRSAGEDVAEMLEWVPGRYKVIRHVRPKFSCARCQKIVQASAASRPIARGVAGPGLLAHVLVSKYADHRVPRTRQLRRRCGAV